MVYGFFFDQHLTGIRSVKSVDHAEERGLAGAAAAEQGGSGVWGEG
jgi:hypothetical protein